MSDGIPCMWMRGGSSKGGYFLAEDLPQDPVERDRVLLRVMGSPDPRQIDGMGGASPLTSKVAIVSRSDRADADIDYLFLQVFVEESRVSDAQPCGNILAGVGPFAIERGLVPANADETDIRIHQTNTGAIACAKIQTPGGRVTYTGNAEIPGVPGKAAPIPLFLQVSPGKCTTTFPLGPVVEVQGLNVTCVDAGMPSVLIRADALGLRGDESVEALKANSTLRERLEQIRLDLGPRMGMGDVAEASVPKMVFVSPGAGGADVTTRCFIPHDLHLALGVLCGVSIIAAMNDPDTPVAEIAPLPDSNRIRLAHPTGQLPIEITRDGGELTQAGSLRTARKLMDGLVFP